MAGWGTFLGKIANWTPNREESRRKKYGKLKKKRQKLFRKQSTQATRNKLARIDRQLLAIEQAAINQ